MENHDAYKRDISSTSAVELVGSILGDLIVESGDRFLFISKEHIHMGFIDPSKVFPRGPQMDD